MGVRAFGFGSLSASKEEYESPAIFTSAVEFSFENYVTAQRPVYPDQAYGQNINLDWDFKSKADKRRFGHRVDAQLRGSVGDEWIYPHVRDLYWTYGDLKIGFAKHRWNEFEEMWRLGLFEPRFMDNKLVGGQGSLFGVHWQKGAFTLSALPLSIPELGPQARVENGQFVSKNPWFGSPPTRLFYRGEFAPVRYSLNLDNLSELVLKPGVAASYATSSSRISAAVKPIPQVILNFPSNRQFVIAEQQSYFAAEIQPEVFYHGVISADHRVVFGASTELTASLAHEIPEHKSLPSDWVTQQFGPATFASLRLDHRIDNANLYMGNFLVWGGDRPDAGRFAGQDTFFDKRQFFRHAYAVGAQVVWSSFTSDFRFTYDIAQSAVWYSHANRYAVSKNLALALNIDLLGVTNESASVRDGFFSVYRGNDRVELGASYAY